MTIRRRDFLASLGGVSLAGLHPLSAREASAAIITPVDDTWDVTWTDKLKGKYRAVFDSPGFSDGAALFRSVIWSRQHKAIYGTAAEELNAVLVVRHQGIWLALNDAFWKKYTVGKRKKFKDGKGQFYGHNPIGSAAPGAPPDFAEMNIPSFTAKGGIVLACNLAFAEVVSTVEKEEKISTAEADKLARTYLLPGVILQPSGVFAVLRAQEVGCHYILAS